jgi:FAD/FMN-containing dehydrogenase
MRDVHVRTLTGEDLVLEHAVIEAFKARLRGALLCPGDTGYDEARRIWNGMIDRRPALIARCAGVADVMQAVNFARTHGLLVAVRGGGHNVPGNAVCDGGLMIDLHPMKSVRVDPARCTARAEAGVVWGEFDRETQAFGLAGVGGTVSDTGIAGLTLGGGLGWLAGKYGLTSDNLLSVDVVTAGGELVTASKDENTELFWGIRGGGGNFGVVTSFEYQLYPVSTVLGGMILYPLAQAKAVLRFYGDFAKAIPDELNTIGALLTTPDNTPVAAIAVCYNGDLRSGEKVLKPLRTFGTPLADEIRPMAYGDIQTLLDGAAQRGRRNYIKSNFMNDISDAAIDTMVEHFTQVPSPLTFTFFQQLGNAANRVRQETTAFSHRQALCEWGTLSIWLEAAHDDVNIRWTRAFAEAMQPFTTGRAYVNQMGNEADEGAADIKAAYGTTYDRLVALKNTYDPTNLFRLNPNIKPTV